MVHREVGRCRFIFFDAKYVLKNTFNEKFIQRTILLFIYYYLVETLDIIC